MLFYIGYNKVECLYFLQRTHRISECDVLVFHFIRIKGILDKGKEVELELLSVRESVELLSAVAQLDTSEVSPCLIEIVSQHFNDDAQ